MVAGAGIAGLAMALAASRAGKQVMLLEQDPAPIATSVEAAFEAERRGAPQVRQTHGFLARLTKVLHQRFPDVHQALLDAGARMLPLTRELGEPRPGDEELAILALRRTTLEWVLRRAVTAETDVTLRTGVAVERLLAAAGGPGTTRRVVGARLGDGTDITGTVVACTGVRGDVPGWLAELDVEIDETVHETQLMYLTRWYRRLDADDVALPPRLGADLGYLKYLAVPCDGGTFSITLAVPVADRELRRFLQDPVNFEAACRHLAGPDVFFRDATLEALGPVLPMGRLVNRLRRFTDPSGEPLVTGFHAVGDAHTCTNPLYGRGCALAFVQATLLVDAMTAHPGDPVAQARQYGASCTRDVEPWFHGAVQFDEFSARRAERQAAGIDSTDVSSPEDLFMRVMTEGGNDPIVGRGILRLANLLVRPEELMTDPEFAAQVLPIVSRPPSENQRKPEGPSRDELLALTGAEA